MRRPGLVASLSQRSAGRRSWTCRWIIEGAVGVVALGARPGRFSVGHRSVSAKKWTFRGRRPMVRLFLAPSRGIGRSRPGLRPSVHRRPSAHPSSSVNVTPSNLGRTVPQNRHVQRVEAVIYLPAFFIPGARTSCTPCQSPATNTSPSKRISTPGCWAPSVKPGTWRVR
jgi:hypothetical protein